MNILRAYKRTRFFLWVNVIGLGIGLATSIMLILFIVNELSYDKDIKDSERIVSLNTIIIKNGEADRMPIATRKALTDVPMKVPGIEAATQIYNIYGADFKYKEENFQNIPALITESGFCDVFGIEFIEGNKEVLNTEGFIIVTEKYANMIFGSVENAIKGVVKTGEAEYTVGAVVKDLPPNTHFQFGLLFAMGNGMKDWPSIEFFTFYKIKEGVSVDETRALIEEEYSRIVSEFLGNYGEKSYGLTEKFTDIYLKSEASKTLGKKSSIEFVWMLSLIAFFILLLAITNFVNLFIAQGETRILEIGVRKVNGATIKEIARQFFSEILTVVFVAFVIGFILVVIFTPYFSALINRDIVLSQLYNPLFIVSVILLFGLTVFLSASYPTMYLAKVNTLDILSKRVRFSKRRLMAVSITFQTVVSIFIISFILVVNSQTNYLKKQPLGYNPENVMVMWLNTSLAQHYDAFIQELGKNKNIEQVSMSDHIFGGGGSGQGLSLVGEHKSRPINEYRVSSGLCEMLELELVEGDFFKQDDDVKNKNSIILNETAVKILGLDYPVVGTTVNYKKNEEIRAVVKDFLYGNIEDKVEPIVLSFIEWGGSFYIKYSGNVSRMEIHQEIQEIVKKFDASFVINPTWLEDIYKEKFNNLEIQSRILLLASVLSIFISMIGLLAMHMLSTMRRKKEIAIRRVNGASQESIFLLLSADIFKWILIAGLITIPFVYYYASDWLNNYSNRITLSWIIFLLPILIQGIIAILVISGVTVKALSQNPSETLKTE